MNWRTAALVVSVLGFTGWTKENGDQPAVLEVQIIHSMN